MNKLSAKKLLHSKWTAIKPQNKEKHFMVIDVEIDEFQRVINCSLQAILSKRQFNIDWKELMDDAKWKQGWK